MEEKKREKFDAEKLQKPVLNLSIISENKQTFKGVTKWLIPSSAISKIFYIKEDKFGDNPKSCSLFSPDKAKAPKNAMSIFSLYIKSGLISIGSSSYSSFNIALYPYKNYFASLSIRFKNKLPDNALVIGDIFIDPLNVGKSFSMGAKDDDKNGVQIVDQQVITFDEIVHSRELLKLVDEEIDIFCHCSIIIEVKEVECAVDKYKVSLTRNYAETDDEKNYSGNCDYFKDPMQLAQEKRSFTDVILKVENCEIKSHRAVLAKVPFFENLFHQNQSKLYFELTDLSFPVLHVVLNYLYTEVVPRLNFSLACEVYIVSSDLDISGLRNICSSYLGSNITQDNVFIIISLSDKYADVDLKKECIKFIQVSNVEMLTRSIIL